MRSGLYFYSNWHLGPKPLEIRRPGQAICLMTKSVGNIPDLFEDEDDEMERRRIFRRSRKRKHLTRSRTRTKFRC